MALGFNFVGNGLRIRFWGSSTASFPLPSLVINGEIASFVMPRKYPRIFIIIFIIYSGYKLSHLEFFWGKLINC